MFQNEHFGLNYQAGRGLITLSQNHFKHFAQIIFLIIEKWFKN